MADAESAVTVGGARGTDSDAASLAMTPAVTDEGCGCGVPFCSSGWGGVCWLSGGLRGDEGCAGGCVGSAWAIEGAGLLLAFAGAAASPSPS